MVITVACSVGLREILLFSSAVPWYHQSALLFQCNYNFFVRVYNPLCWASLGSRQNNSGFSISVSNILRLHHHNLIPESTLCPRYSVKESTSIEDSTGLGQEVWGILQLLETTDYQLDSLY